MARDEIGPTQKNMYRCRVCGAPKRGHVCIVDQASRGKGRFRPFEADLNHLIHRIEELERELVEVENDNESLRKRLSKYEHVAPSPRANLDIRQVPIRPPNPIGQLVFVPYRGPPNKKKRRSPSVETPYSSEPESKVRKEGELSSPNPPQGASEPPTISEHTHSHSTPGLHSPQHRNLSGSGHLPVFPTSLNPYFQSEYLPPQSSQFYPSQTPHPRHNYFDYQYPPDDDDTMYEQNGRGYWSHPLSNSDNYGYF